MVAKVCFKHFGTAAFEHYKRLEAGKSILLLSNFADYGWRSLVERMPVLKDLAETTLILIRLFPDPKFLRFLPQCSYSTTCPTHAALQKRGWGCHSQGS
jgi:hypothetical protein